MHSPFTTENQKHQRSENCPKWEPCEELNLLWKHCQRLEVPMSSLSCVTDTGRSLCSNEQLRSDVHSCPRALIHWGMIIQPISVIYDFMIKCFISQPAHGTRGDSHNPGSAEGPHTHISNATTASLPIQELVLPGQSSHDVGAVVLVTLLKENTSSTGKRSDIREHQGNASGLCPAAVTAGGFPFPISLLSFSNVKVDGKSTHSICSRSLLSCLLLQCSFTFSCPAPRAQSAARNQARRTFPSRNN